MERYQSQPQQAPVESATCRADGCTCGTTFNGLCYFHSEAKNPAAWGAITKIMQSEQFKFLAWFFEELQKWHFDCTIRVGEKFFRMDELVRFYQQYLVAFGIKPELVTYGAKDTPRRYAIRMRELVLAHVLAITGGNDGNAPQAEKAMPAWVAKRIKEIVSEAFKPREPIVYQPPEQASKAINDEYPF